MLAIGNDGHRDWETLVRAAPAIDAEIRILTRHPRPASLPENVRWEPADWHRRLLSDEDVREAFRAAAAVAVPVKDVPQPSGQSVTLQASACARPVVLSRTRGLWDPDGLRDGENVLLVPPGDPEALAEALRRVLADRRLADGLGRAARASVEATAGVEGYAERLLAICELARRTALTGRAAVYGSTLMSLKTKPRAAVVHARSAVRRVGSRLATERDLRASRSARADVSVFHDDAPPPSGGGNQFVRALVGELERRRPGGRGEPHLGRHASLPLQLVQLRPRRGCDASRGTTCGWCTGSTARSASTGGSTTGPTRGSRR